MRAALDAVPSAAPALVRATALQGRAERAGHPPPAEAPAERLRAALSALDARVESNGAGADEARVGELLWAAVALARERGVDAESALRTAAASFVKEVAGADGIRRDAPST